jgi:phage terminase small subunit
MPRHLTPKQRAFAQNIADGMEQSAAFRAAYGCPNSSPRTIKVNASRMRANPKVAAFVAELQAKQDRVRFLTRERKREKLAAIVEDEKAVKRDVIKAIEVDNVMTGDNAPQQVQVFGLGDLLNLVRKQSK